MMKCKMIHGNTTKLRQHHRTWTSLVLIVLVIGFDLFPAVVAYPKEESTDDYDAVPWIEEGETGGPHYLRKAVIFNQDHSLGTREARELQAISSNCNSVRSKDDYYSTELQLYYVYEVEFEDHAKSRSLAGLEAVITAAVMEAFVDACDLLDRPLYQVKTNMRHQFSKDEFCAPAIEGNTCNVINGATAILLDESSPSDTINIQDIIFGAIADGLADTEQVRRFSPSVVRAEFLNPLGETWIDEASPTNDASNSSGGSTTVAVAAASVSFVVASIFCYGLMRREMAQHPEPSIRHKFRRHRSSSSIVTRPSMGLGPPIRRSRRFVPLDEFASARFPGEFGCVVSDDEEDEGHGDDNDDIAQNYTPSITWSISDITSDSAASVRSSVSWTTSRLERIDEAEEEEDEYEDGGHHNNRKRKRLATFKSRQKSPPRQHPPLIPVVVGMELVETPPSESSEGEMAEVPGCLNVLDGETKMDNHIRSVTPDSVGASSTFVDVAPVMPEVDDSQVSLDEEELSSVVADKRPMPVDPPGSHSDESGTVVSSVSSSDDGSDKESSVLLEDEIAQTEKLDDDEVIEASTENCNEEVDVAVHLQEGEQQEEQVVTIDAESEVVAKAEPALDDNREPIIEAQSSHQEYASDDVTSVGEDAESEVEAKAEPALEDNREPIIEAQSSHQEYTSDDVTSVGEASPPIASSGTSEGGPDLSMATGKVNKEDAIDEMNDESNRSFASCCQQDDGLVESPEVKQSTEAETFFTPLQHATDASAHDESSCFSATSHSQQEAASSTC